jgi:hypothetical protein
MSDESVLKRWPVDCRFTTGCCEPVVILKFAVAARIFALVGRSVAEGRPRFGDTPEGTKDEVEVVPWEDRLLP